jgi:eukaryotic-like serine/threonine-protein kinase
MTDRWSATERIFHAALERPVEARAAFLAEACGDDAELRREVQSLLDEASAPGFLEQPALQIAAGLVTSASLAPLTGQRLGVYSITALLGRGGMGEVYRARDTRLGREVAIKVLPPALTAHPDRLARFEREARVLASLNHPHIGMLYGIEEGGGHLALVLELVEGETLAERLARGPSPLKEALAWARQIADALDAAHEKGIVHRDLKPANIKITPQGVVKVLDFGLARTYGVGSEAGVTSTPTITIEAGLIVGTAAYMSPEQARGQAVDKRADVWAFGCVLYELLTGRLAFAGATVPDMLAGVLHQEPDWSALPSGLPPAVATLLRRCLEKDVRRRRRDIGDVRGELDDALAQPARAAAPAIPPRARWLRVVPVALAGAAAIAAGTLGARSRISSAWKKCRPCRPMGRTSRSWRPLMAAARSGSGGSQVVRTYRLPTMTAITTIRAGLPTRAPSCTSRQPRRKATPGRFGRSLHSAARRPAGLRKRQREPMSAMTARGSRRFRKLPVVSTSQSSTAAERRSRPSLYRRRSNTSHPGGRQTIARSRSS